MRKYLFLFLFVLSSVAFGSCETRISKGKGESGTLSLNVKSDDKDYIDVYTKSGVDINTFSIVIRDSEGVPVSSWDSLADMPSSVTLSPGTYTVIVESPESSPAAFDQPAYRGEESFVIKSGELTMVNVVCSLSNVKVTIELGDTFKAEVKDYTITVRAVNYNKSLVFTPEIIETGASGYFSVSPLEVHIIGKRVLDDSPVNELVYVEDINARDHIILKINARATGDVGRFTITVDYSTNDRTEDVEVPGFPEDPVEGNDPEDPDPVKPEITFSCPDDVTFTDSEAAEAVVDVTVISEKGIENLYVEIKSETLLALLGALNLGEAVSSGNWDIANITDPALAEFLSGLGLYSESDPIKGKKEHTFSIGSFMALMPAQEEPYPFLIRVVDSEGAENTRTLTVYRVN